MYKWAFNIESEENEQKLLKFPLFFSYIFFVCVGGGFEM